jgi:L-iditol 2-dehydrogenase
VKIRDGPAAVTGDERRKPPADRKSPTGKVSKKMIRKSEDDAETESHRRRSEPMVKGPDGNAVRALFLCAAGGAGASEEVEQPAPIREKMEREMKAITLKEIGRFEYGEAPDPVPGRGELLLRVEVTGVCRTDVKILEHGHRDLVLPRIPGEEVVGTVAGFGPGGGEGRFRIGERVYVYPGTSCGRCRNCRRGFENLCEEMEIMGFHRDGGFAEYLVVPERAVIPVPEGLASDAAVLAEPLSCCLNGLDLTGVGPGGTGPGSDPRGHRGTSGDLRGSRAAGDTETTVCVWGAGPAGSLLAEAAAARGCSVTRVDPDPGRGNYGGALSRVPEGVYYDICIPAVGDTAAYREALTHCGDGGTVLLFSGLLREDNPFPVDINDLHYRQITLVGAYGCCYRHGEEALELLSRGLIDIDRFITHRFPLAQTGKALETVRERRGLKVLLYPN